MSDRTRRSVFSLAYEPAEETEEEPESDFDCGVYVSHDHHINPLSALSRRPRDGLDVLILASPMSSTIVVSRATWLCPRPLARCPSHFLLLPLLPHRPVCKALPSEIWSQVLEHVFTLYNTEGPTSECLKQGLLLVSKDFNAVALPLFYVNIRIRSLHVLKRLATRLHDADQRWDSIRRIPYSAPGRWIQALDLEQLCCTSPEDVLQLDTVLNQVFPVTPLLASFIMNPHTALSRRVLSNLTYRDGARNIRVLRGFQLPTSMRTDEDAFVELLRACTRLEEFEVVGTGLDPTELLFSYSNLIDPPPSLYPLHLPFLRKLVVLSMPYSPVLFALLHSPLPALQHLTLTPYDEVSVPTSLIPAFMVAHGPKLTSLHLYTVKQWPTTLFPSPATLLDLCSSLKHLSLELPLPSLTLSTAEQHQLEILSLPRPKPEYLDTIESLLPKLPKLRFVRARDVKWLRNGMSARAQQAGVQGEMLLWRRKLGRRGIQMLDAEWKSGLE